MYNVYPNENIRKKVLDFQYFCGLQFFPFSFEEVIPREVLNLSSEITLGYPNKLPTLSPHNRRQWYLVQEFSLIFGV